MLASTNRLKRPRDIANVQRRGRYAVGEELMVKSAKNGLEGSRAVVIVSKKVSKKAVVRNRIRRRLAASLAEQWATVRQGYDIVITVRGDIADAPASKLNRELTAVLDQNGLRKTK
jgi:ribonuclease P protein component